MLLCVLRLLHVRALQFDDRERCSLRVDKDCKTSDLRNIVSRFHDLRAEFRRFLDLRVAVVDGEVDEPVGHS